jgi:hypothetical protein
VTFVAHHLSLELGLSAARLATWREVFLNADYEALQQRPLECPR